MGSRPRFATILKRREAEFRVSPVFNVDSRNDHDETTIKKRSFFCLVFDTRYMYIYASCIVLCFCVFALWWHSWCVGVRSSRTYLMHT